MPDWLIDVRARLATRRRAILYWLAVAGLVAVAAGTLLRVTAAASATVGRWGPGHATVLATRDLPAGTRLTADDVEVVDLPAVARPATAVADPPLGATLRTDVFAGEPLTAGRLGRVGEGGVAAAVPPGHRGVAIAPGGAAPAVTAGDVVELRATTLDQTGAVVGSVAGTGPVVDAGDEAIVVAVPDDRVPAVVEAITYGEVVVVVVPAREASG